MRLHSGNQEFRRAENDSALKEVACLFLKLGIIGFGSPMAHIAMMEDEVVRLSVAKTV